MSPPSFFEAELPTVRAILSENGQLRTEAICSACEGVIKIVEKLGPGLALVRMDVGGNVRRLRDRAGDDPRYLGDTFEIVREELAAQAATSSDSCANAVLWLRRAMSFMIEFVLRLRDDPALSPADGARLSYETTLSRYHSWIVAGTFSVAFSLLPSREVFEQRLLLAEVGEDSWSGAEAWETAGGAGPAYAARTSPADSGLPGTLGPAQEASEGSGLPASVRSSMQTSNVEERGSDPSDVPAGPVTAAPRDPFRGCETYCAAFGDALGLIREWLAANGLDDLPSK